MLKSVLISDNTWWGETMGGIHAFGERNDEMGIGKDSSVAAAEIHSK